MSLSHVVYWAPPSQERLDMGVPDYRCTGQPVIHR
ncbi:hypothetical protein GQ607_009124 [Colletotrichum asianum]|uniref:Uncharacterized protein n=1 Tax=Colletotrichum asianum TaxID=702518 RepID=A0A8H3ZLG5_9PEZI|nr:hypothetical protein GQ607_009124 [Colletotrichum asianum]